MTHMKRNITLGSVKYFEKSFQILNLDIRLKAALKALTKMDSETFVERLEKSGSGLNVETLVNLALHEPRTFEVIRIYLRLEITVVQLEIRQARNYAENHFVMNFFIGFVNFAFDFWFARLSRLASVDSEFLKMKHEFERSRVTIFAVFFSFKEFEDALFVKIPVQSKTGRQKLIFFPF